MGVNKPVFGFLVFDECLAKLIMGTTGNIDDVLIPTDTIINLIKSIYMFSSVLFYLT